MYVLTTRPDTLSDGAYATYGEDGTIVLQFFVDKEDAMSYNVQLEALSGKELFITEVADEESINKLCDLLGYAYSIAEPGEVIIPRIEDQ